MRWFLLFIFFSLPVFAQISVSKHTKNPTVLSQLPQNNVTAVYDTTTKKVLMIVEDANDLTDPAWNPPGTAQLPIPVTTYNAFTKPEDVMAYISSAISAVGTTP